MYKSILVAAGGLLAIASAAPVRGDGGKCINGTLVDIIRFDTLEAGSGIPNNYAGFEWNGFGVFKAPSEKSAGFSQTFFGATLPNVVHATGKRYGGQINLLGDRDKTFRILSFDAACYKPDAKVGAKAVDCKIELQGLNGDAVLFDHFNYAASKDISEFQSFGPNPIGDEKAYQFTVAGNKKSKPVLAIDNIVFERGC